MTRIPAFTTMIFQRILDPFAALRGARSSADGHGCERKLLWCSPRLYWVERRFRVPSESPGSGKWPILRTAPNHAWSLTHGDPTKAVPTGGRVR